VPHSKTGVPLFLGFIILDYVICQWTVGLLCHQCIHTTQTSYSVVWRTMNCFADWLKRCHVMFMRHSNMTTLNLWRPSVENVALGLRPHAIFSTSGQSYFHVGLTTVHHLYSIVLLLHISYIIGLFHGCFHKPNKQRLTSEPDRLQLRDIEVSGHNSGIYQQVVYNCQHNECTNKPTSKHHTWGNSMVIFHVNLDQLILVPLIPVVINKNDIN